MLLASVLSQIHLMAQPPADFSAAYARKREKQAWKTDVPAILAQINVPGFANRKHTISDFGARPGEDARAAIRQAVEACHRNGGGRVVVPAGTYPVNGPIHLLSHVNLHLERGAVLKFSVNPADYLPVVKVRWEGTVCYNYSPLIYAYQAENVAITGEGLIDGQTELFWHEWKKLQEPDKKILRQMGNDTIPEKDRVFGEGHRLRPDGIQFYECKNILFEDFSIKSSPFWTIHPVFCENVTARRLNIQRGTTNDDGFDPESCKNVLIENCRFDTNDDCIAVKAGRDQDAWKRPGTENIVVRNCTFRTEVGSGFCIGSEMSGGVKNVFVENCTIESQNHALNFKCNRDRGGFMERIFVRNVRVSSCKYGLTFTTDYHSWRGNHFPTRYNDFYLSNISLNEATEACLKVTGLPEKPITRLWFDKIVCLKTPKPADVKHTEQVLFHAVKINGAALEMDVVGK
ncbi:MAG: glycoside hydrolase family 28 protein [Cytophagales bacterium]|nr:glycoside hydrolase family 28 protein [Cytophagales bacterium]